MKKIEDLLMAYSLIRPTARLSLRNNKDLVWQKTATTDIKSALLAVLGRNISIQLKYVTEISADNKVSVSIWKTCSILFTHANITTDDY